MSFMSVFEALPPSLSASTTALVRWRSTLRRFEKTEGVTGFAGQGGARCRATATLGLLYFQRLRSSGDQRAIHTRRVMRSGRRALLPGTARWHETIDTVSEKQTMRDVCCGSNRNEMTLRLDRYKNQGKWMKSRKMLRLQNIMWGSSPPQHER